MMKAIIRRATRQVGFDITRYRPEVWEAGFASVKSPRGSRGDVLLSYVIEPFLLKRGELVSRAHTNNWESLQMAKTFLDLGYHVDTIGSYNVDFAPKKDYRVFISDRNNLERIAKLLPEACLKIAHLDTAHWLFNNEASYARCLGLQSRKGVTIPNSMRLQAPNLAIEYADYAMTLGNEFTMGTYRYANKPIIRIPISTCVLNQWSEDKDYEACRKNFLWFGSSGMVHRGVDLLLEAFAEMPEYHLTLCGPVERETNFVKAYSRELYHSPNIHMVGWVDIASDMFKEITQRCGCLIYPTCSEGGGGSVLTCMHAGIVPIVSYEASVDVNEEYGVLLKTCSITDIQDAVRTAAEFPAWKLESMSRKAWEFARANHTRERFADRYREAMLHILELHATT